MIAVVRRVFVSKLNKEELQCRSTKKAPFAFNMRRPVLASRCCSFLAGIQFDDRRLKRGGAFDAIEEFKGEYSCIFSDMRNANGGQSYGRLEIDRPWMPIPMTISV